jgi:hypothetical protein
MRQHGTFYKKIIEILSYFFFLFLASWNDGRMWHQIRQNEIKYMVTNSWDLSFSFMECIYFIVLGFHKLMP